MTRYLLDTNIISNATRPQPSEHLVDWLGAQADDSLFIASLTIGEIRRGILELSEGTKRNALETWFNGPEGPLGLFAGRILTFDSDTAMIWARLMAEGKTQGRPRSALDMLIAATAQAHSCVVVTDNERDFAGIDFINPMRPV